MTPKEFAEWAFTILFVVMAFGAVFCIGWKMWKEFK